VVRVEEATAFGAFLSFSLYGFNRGEAICVPGTGFCIAPGLALTAKHVSDEILRKLAIPEGMAIPRGQNFYEGVEVRAAQQEIGGESSELTPWWYVEGAFNSKVTDISLLILSPGNDAARRADQRGRYLRWSLSPPVVEQRLWAFGYAIETLERETVDGKQTILFRYIASTQPVKVASVFENGRRERELDVPLILGANQSSGIATHPCFEVEGEITPSMSGGPVFNGDLLYGVVSTGTRVRDEQGVERDISAIAVLMRPLLEMGEVSLGEGHPRLRIADLISTGRIGWLQ
jgi:hypothetical protein